MGGRLLKQWLARPLLDVDIINHREEMVQAFLMAISLVKTLLMP